ncbi:glucuronyl hydrolase [Oleiharenicola lentus]|uniref:Glucuronyl hydrolase n=2 Tax=Oleiharenicola lentus TaxID=2508720 RepID=A0A4Q1CD03_9BACT|nr:glucuronyl hydrolase [Oleiharenicola lentus]
MLREIEGQPGLPRSVDGSARKMSERDWTIGFFPGALWYLFEATGDVRWRDAAQRYTARTESFQHNRGTHDVGFVLYCGYGNGLRLTGDDTYRRVLLTGAASLATRFSPVVGAIKSWDRPGRWDFPVIIDNMMNLELLLWAAQTDPRYREIALKHADSTLREIIRPDGSQFHVVEFDSATGQVKQKFTHQGAADDSTWSRGQAWAIYGYTMMYRFTREPRYLQQARACADYVLNHPNLPEDMVPYWDFNAPQIPATARDSSAAAVMASALYELADYSGPDSARYAAWAEAILRSLTSPAYLAPVGSNYGFLLAHGTGSYRSHLEVDAPLIYGDYYFLEALIRARARLK